MSEVAQLIGYGAGLFILTTFAGFGLVLGGWIALLLASKLMGKW